MQSLHPRYPVLKVPAPARLSAAVAQGLMMPETGAPGGGNLHLHILYTFQSPQRLPSHAIDPRVQEYAPLIPWHLRPLQGPLKKRVRTKECFPR